MRRRLIQLTWLAAMSSVYLMQVPCTKREHGFSIFPSIGGTSLSSLTGLVT